MRTATRYSSRGVATQAVAAATKRRRRRAGSVESHTPQPTVMTLSSGSSTRTAAAAAAAVTVVTVTTAAAAAAAVAHSSSSSNSAVPQKLRDPIALRELGPWTWAFKYAIRARCSELTINEMTAATTAVVAAAETAGTLIQPPRPEGIHDGPTLGNAVYTHASKAEL
jgi:hypothetical protein